MAMDQNVLSFYSSASCMLAIDLGDFSIPSGNHRIMEVPYRRQHTEFDVVVCKYCGRNQKFPDSGECRACGASLEFYTR